jgi:hypothetical protein
MLIGNASAPVLRLAVRILATGGSCARRQKNIDRPYTNRVEVALTLARQMEDAKQTIARNVCHGYEGFSYKPLKQPIENPIDT